MRMIALTLALCTVILAGCGQSGPTEPGKADAEKVRQMEEQKKKAESEERQQRQAR